jgi:pentatricopeptide repeat protein
MWARAECIGTISTNATEGVKPDHVTFVGILNACASVEALEEGAHVHQHIIQSGWESDVFVGSSLIDIYAKCGSMQDAWKVFNKMPFRNVVSWNAMLEGFAMRGHAKVALAHFEWMCQGVNIDNFTVVCLLSACTHMGLVDEGLHYFDSMCSVYNISATVEHFSCMVDLLCCTSHLQ